MSSSLPGLPGGPLVQIASSIATITLLEYLRPMLAQAMVGVVGNWVVILTQSIILYLELAAYSKGWISIPSTIL